MLTWLRCARKGHRINLFPNDPEGVSRIAYECDCGRAWVTRKVRNDTIDRFLENLFSGAA